MLQVFKAERSELQASLVEQKQQVERLKADVGSLNSTHAEAIKVCTPP